MRNAPDSAAPMRSVEEVKAMLDTTEKGGVRNSIRNCLTVFQYDPLLAGALAYNLLTDRTDLVKPIGCQRPPGASMTDTDMKYIRLYLEETYGLTSERKIADAADLAAHQNSYHPVRDYLNGLEWDGTERIRFCLRHFLGAAADTYTCEALKLFLLGAIHRAYRPGCKFEVMLCLVGGQGAGKSTFFRLLAVRDEWFSDDLRRLDDDNVYRKLQGHWIIEMSEMIATANAKSIEEIKSFLSRQKEVYKIPYETHPADRPCQCVFGGTSNALDFLPLDRSGNRRFLPVLVNPEQAEVHILEDEAASRAYISQLWAEAMALYRAGRWKLTFSPELVRYLKDHQRDFMPEDKRTKTCSACGDSGYEYADHTDANGDGKCDDCGATVSLTIKWDAGTNGGTIDGKASITTTGKPNATATAPTSTPVKTGHAFKGWYTSASGGSLYNTVTITAAKTFYAQFTANSYTLTWDLGNGTTEETKQTYGEKLTLPTEPTRKNAEFLGWFTEATGGTQVDANTIYKTDGDSTYYAHWEITEVFSVTVPVTLPLVVDESGEVHTGSAEIINGSTGAVVVSSVGISTKNGWQLVPFDTDMAHEKVDAQLLGFKINDSETTKTGDAETFSLTSPWTIAENGRLPINYDAVVSAVSKAITEQGSCPSYSFWSGAVNKRMDEEKAADQMTVLVVEPGYAPYEKTIPHELHAMQEIVGGLITAIYPYEEPVGIVANDEGLLLDMDFNRSVEGGYGGLVGPFFVCGLTEDSFCSLPPDQMERFKKKFHKAEILVGFCGNEPVTLKVEPKQKNATPEKQRKPPSQER